jgi:ribonuclease VapC
MVAIIKRESDWLTLSERMESADLLRISVASYLEISIVLDKHRDPVRSARLDDLIEELGMVIEPVTVTQGKIARQAYRDYGKGSGHRTGLNFGDCLSYALARDKREPMLYKGDDFVHTDIGSAMQQH